MQPNKMAPVVLTSRRMQAGYFMEDMYYDDTFLLSYDIYIQSFTALVLKFVNA